MRKGTALSFAICLCLCLTSCSLKPGTSNIEGRLIILCDEQDRPVVRSAIENSFARIVHTPQPEALFNLTWVTGDALPDLTNMPVLLLAAPLEGEGSSSQLLHRMLSPEVRTGIENDDFGIFVRHDPWARGQLMMILTGENRSALGRNATAWCDSLLQICLQSEYDRLRNSMLDGALNKIEISNLKTELGIGLDLQIDYNLAQYNDSLDFIRYIRYSPERWIAIAWGELTSDPMSPEFVFQRRKEIAGSFIDRVITYDDHWTSEEAQLGERNAILIRGLWATESSIGGGPFFTYAVEIPEENRYYIVDGAVLAPSELKMPYLWQLDVMAQTFKSASDNKEDR